MEKIIITYKKSYNIMSVIFAMIFVSLFTLTFFLFPDDTNGRFVIKIIILVVWGISLIMSLLSFVENTVTKTIIDDETFVRIKPTFVRQEIHINDIGYIKIIDLGTLPPYKILIFDRANRIKVSFYDGGEVTHDKRFVEFCNRKSIKIVTTKIKMR